MKNDKTKVELIADLEAAEERVARLEQALKLASLPNDAERKQAEDALHRHNQLLSAVVDIEHSLAASINPVLVYESLKQGIQRTFPDVATIFISSFDADRRMIKAMYGSQDGSVVDVASLPEIPLAPEGGGGTQSRVIHTRQPLVINSDLRKNFISSTVVQVGDHGEKVTQSALYVPMLAHDKVLGVIQLQSYLPNRFTEEDVRALTLIANTAAVSIQNSLLYETAQAEIKERRQAEQELSSKNHELQDIAQQLEQSHNTLQYVISSIPMRVFWKDRNFRYLGCNALFAADSGFDHPDQLLGRDDFDMKWREQAELYRKDDREVMESGLPKINIIEPQTTPMGNMIWLNTSKVPLKNSEGEVYGILGVYEDITERKHAEDALHDSESRFSTVFQCSPLGIAITRLRDNALLEINQAWLDLLEFNREEVIGRTVLDLGVWEKPQDRQNMIAGLQAHGHMTYFESTFRKKSGKNLNALISSEAVVIGSEPCMLTQFIDITERKQSENALAASEKKLKSLIDSQTHFVLRVNLEGKYSYCNPKFEREFGWIHPEGFPNTYSLDTIHAYHHQRLMSVVRNCIAHPGKVFSVELDKPAQDGGTRTTLWEFMCLTDENNQPSEIQCMGIEITDRKKAEDALRESEEKYRGLTESLDSVITTVDYEGKFLYMNNLGATQLGGRPEEFIGKNILELFPEPFGSRQLAAIQKVISDDAAATFEATSLGVGGLRWYRFSLQPLHDENGHPTHVLINVTDIHESKTAQYELQELNRTLEDRVKQRATEVQDLYDNAPIGYHSLDANGKVVMINQTQLNWLGYTREEVIGHSVSEFLTPESLAVFLEYYPKFIQQGWVRDFEYEMKRKDGSVFPVLINGTAIRDERGNYIMSRSTIFDNTERKAMETSLRESEKKNRLLFELSPDAVILSDEEGRAVEINHAFEVLTGFSKENFIGQVFGKMDLLPPKQAERLKAATLKTLQQKDNFASAEFKLKRADGEMRDMGLRIFALKLQGRQHYLSTMRDITFEKKTEEALRLANAEMERALRMKDEFLANMSHELRTPLNAILGLSESLLEQTAGPLNDKQKRYLGTVSESGHHLLNLINDILDLAKVEAGQITLDVTSVDIQSVCEASLRMIRQLAQTKKQEIEVDIEAEIGSVRADERRLKQMIVNLLSNAVKFTPEGGRIGLKASIDREDRMLLISVWDHGIGINEKDLDRLFRPFVQLDAGLARESSGTGLGLALVAQMARLHGGSVSVFSEAGNGSRFTLILPWVPATDSVRVNQQDVTSVPVPIVVETKNRKTILLVDDTESVLMLYRDYLERHGYKVELANDGVEGVRRAIELRPDLILMDVMMPGMNGIDATKRIRREECLSHVPIIALTALAMPSDRQRCLDAGMSDYISKPISLNELLALVKKHLSESS